MVFSCVCGHAVVCTLHSTDGQSTDVARTYIDPSYTHLGLGTRHAAWIMSFFCKIVEDLAQVVCHHGHPCIPGCASTQTSVHESPRAYKHTYIYICMQTYVPHTFAHPGIKYAITNKQAHHHPSNPSIHPYVPHILLGAA